MSADALYHPATLEGDHQPDHQPWKRSWNEIAPDFAASFETVDTLWLPTKNLQGLGQMNTVWTNDSVNLMRMSCPRIAYGVIAPWQSAPVDRKQFFANYLRVIYPTNVAVEAAAAFG